MADIGVLERVGKKEEQLKEPPPPRVRSKKEDGELSVLCEMLHRQGEPEGAHEERSF